MNAKDIFHITIEELYEKFPYIDDYFTSLSLDITPYSNLNIIQISEKLHENFRTTAPITQDEFIQNLYHFICEMQTLSSNNQKQIQSITILPGIDKNGTPEKEIITLKPGKITAIVGKTGSGKSRFLEDIESLAQEDTPTKRTVLINNTTPSDNIRFNPEENLVAQLSQNMNFVMDLTVEDFLTMHAESRMIENISHIVNKIFQKANTLAGESFNKKTAITQLSGGQSRALMIADTALLSTAPIILIDEIENAGVDKIKALDLLIKSNKIVIMSTHDPLLALSADQRIIIQNGGIKKIIKTTKEEKSNLDDLKKIDTFLTSFRNQIRNGKTITKKIPL